MKKNYISPFAMYIVVECNTIIAASEKIEIDNEGGSEHLGNKNQGSWGNLWEKK
ncbi:MAG: hypothetical protein IJX41_03825 [Bacteroidaceae bacterium]|nr:hypothetical protein [Bacteroidaceae bacterium]